MNRIPYRITTAILLFVFCLIGLANAEPATGHVQHVVICWLKNPGNTQERETLITASHELAKIPGVLSVNAGQVLAGARPLVDSSFDVAVVMTFVDEASLRAYGTNPMHLKAVQELLIPLTAKVLVYDFVE